MLYSLASPLSPSVRQSVSQLVQQPCRTCSCLLFRSFLQVFANINIISQSNRNRECIHTMSEGCSGCKASKCASSNSSIKLNGPGANVCNVCSSSADLNGCSCSCLSKSQVQVRAKVLYGSGTAIANLRAKEKATNRPNL